MRTRKLSSLAAIAAAATITLSGLTAAPAHAQIDDTSSQLPFADQLSSEEPWSTWGDAAFSIIGSAIWTPVILSAMGSSLLGPQCHLGDTRGCQSG